MALQRWPAAGGEPAEIMKKTTRPTMLQVATNRARADSVRRALVPAVLALVPRGRSAAPRARPDGGIVKLRLAAAFDTQHGGFATGWVNVTMPLRYMRPGDASLMRATV